MRIQVSNYFLTDEQLSTADENENQPRELKLGSNFTFRIWMKITFKLCHNSCYQLSTAIDS